MAAMPCGCCLPSAFAMYFRPDGSARYAPVWTLSCRLKRFASRCSAYSIHVLSSTPGAAVFLSPRKPAGRTAMLTRCRECCQLVLSVPGDGSPMRGRRWRSPGSRAKGFCACQGLRRRGLGMCLAISTPAVLPSVGRKNQHPELVLRPSIPRLRSRL